MARSAPFHVALLAGGSGTRFWPLSRSYRPKQLLALAGREPLLISTWKRVRKLAPPRRIWVVTPAALEAQVRKLLPELHRGNVIVEPSPRDTAPAVTLACAVISAVEPGAVVGLFPTDHVIRDPAEYVRAVRVAARAAAAGALVCLGIRPDHAATGFGYLECGSAPRRDRAVAVERFVEKPDAARARRFLRSGRYLWNAGMFVWRAERFLEEAERVAPQIVRPVREFVAGKKGAWTRAVRRSVDFAVMEKARGVRVVALEAGWDDVGSWDAAGRLREAEGLSDPRHVVVGSPGSVIFGEGRLIALVDAPGVAVVDTPDALLVVARSSSERVRAVVAELRRRRRTDLL